jgi:lysophospholipase L1-like esterase
MNFHLNIHPVKSSKKINYSNKCFFIGSCFSENIGSQMSKYKFDVLMNPNGILFNPYSIFKALNDIIEYKPLTENELFFANDVWNHWDYHSRFSSPDKKKCILEINQSKQNANLFLKQTDVLFITLGSAHAYFLQENNELVGNCHKVPQQQFNKQLLSIDKIIEQGTKLIHKINRFNPNLSIVFTVSPVRYIRDGIIENNRSKARLIEAVHELIANNPNCIYFPAYELIIDDLRDYRFYETDLVHPNEQAIDYVFEKLKETFFATETKDLFLKISNIIKAKSHKPFNAETSKHKQFKSSLLKECNDLIADYPFLNLQEEINFFDV